MGASRNSAGSRIFEAAAAACLLAALSAGAAAWCRHQGYTLYYGDAMAHLNIARRVVDSRTPGYDQIGTAWLPLPHLLMLPLVRDDHWWRSGLAGTVPSAAAFVLAGLFLFLAARRVLESRAAALAAVAMFALNPNVLYLQSIPMTETLFFASLAATAWCTAAWRKSRRSWWVAAAGLATLAGTLTRYEGWFVIPFVTGYFLVTAEKRRLAAACLYGSIASLGPLYWMGHNLWYFGDPLEFYRGPWSAKAIYQRALDAGMQRYPGDGEPWKAVRYYLAAARLCAGWPLALLGAAGSLALVWKRKVWPALLLAMPPAFYVWSLYSAGTPIFVPHLWPNSHYNTRYGTAALPLFAFAAGALVLLAPARRRALAAGLLTASSTGVWLLAPAPGGWICWKESEVNSELRRAWTREAAGFLRARYRGGGILMSFGDLTGVFLEAGIPLRETLHSGNNPEYAASVARPDLFLREKWAVAQSGDEVATAVLRGNRNGARYECVKMVSLRGAPVIEIYERRSLPGAEVRLPNSP